MTCDTPNDFKNARFSGDPAVAKIYGAGALRQRYRRQPDAAGGGVNQHPITSLNLCQMIQREMCGYECYRHSHNFVETHPSRLWRNPFRARRDIAREATRRDGYDWISKSEMADSFTDRHDFACALRSQRSRIARIESHHVHHVPEVQGSGMNSNLHLSSVREGDDPSCPV